MVTNCGELALWPSVTVTAIRETTFQEDLRSTMVAKCVGELWRKVDFLRRFRMTHVKTKLANPPSQPRT